ncbi:MAG: hypothetical protein HYR76_10145 [Ignavibacteria bacterium]|nr:hypothetical protein [Ignavibacteria bacterium]
MKRRMLFGVIISMIFSLSLSVAQTKTDCAVNGTSAKKSCCMEGAKASMTSETKATEQPDATLHTMTVSSKVEDEKSSKNDDGDSKECVLKGAKMSNACTTADKAHCDMGKSGKMMKTSNKLDCCKGKAKAAEAKNTEGKTKQDKSTSDGRGTN